jgi:hypothetical protein
MIVAEVLMSSSTKVVEGFPVWLLKSARFGDLGFKITATVS